MPRSRRARLVVRAARAPRGRRERPRADAFRHLAPTVHVGARHQGGGCSWCSTNTRAPPRRAAWHAWPSSCAHTPGLDDAQAVAEVPTLCEMFHVPFQVTRARGAWLSVRRVVG